MEKKKRLFEVSALIVYGDDVESYVLERFVSDGDVRTFEEELYELYLDKLNEPNKKFILLPYRNKHNLRIVKIENIVNFYIRISDYEEEIKWKISTYKK